LFRSRIVSLSLVVLSKVTLTASCFLLPYEVPVPAAAVLALCAVL